ncbi:MAG: helix-turn-helix domain-containing protein [Treponema sp.]|nr:helix-turn-helix domain-containing protein [Treponema sp.]
MESYGEILQKTREEKNLDIDKIVREISIEKRFLVGLENEDYSAFPGEAYMVGFLRNYSNYLELDTNFILKLYNNKKIQEAPVPVELLAKRKSPFLLPAIIIPSVLIVGVILTISILLVNKKKAAQEDNVIVASNQTINKYELNNEKFAKRIYKGDQLLFPSNNGNIILTVKDTLSSFGLETPSGVIYTDLSEENEIDIDGDTLSDMIVYVSDISDTDEKRGAEVSILLRHGSFVSDSANQIENINLATDLKTSRPYKVILEDNRAYPFTINVSFRGPCLFRDRIDNSNSVETYFTSGEVFTANPKNGIRLWISNSNVVKISLIADTQTFDFDIGASGQVLVEDIKWIKDVDGKYKLVVIELD